MIVYDSQGNQKDVVTQLFVRNAKLGVGKHYIPNSQGAKMAVLNVQNSGNSIQDTFIFFLGGNESFILRSGCNITVMAERSGTVLFDIANLPSGSTVHDYVLYF